MAEFKIGRLRFTWKGTWATTTTYNRDAVVLHEGKMYTCLEPHTSTDFYTDLNYVNLNGVQLPRWQLTVPGKTWRGHWAPNTYYKLDNIVAFGGALYTCSIPHTSDTIALDVTKFDIYTTFDHWNTSWQPNTAYGFGDLVKYGGIVYECQTNHVSAVDTTLGLEADQSKWLVVINNIDFKGIWNSSSYRYRANDLVKNGPNLYICTTGHMSTSTFDMALWDIWMPGEEYIGTWSSSVTYQIGEVVDYGGYAFVCNVDNNINKVPSTNPVEWTVLHQDYALSGDWNRGTNYLVGDVVRKNGYLFAATADNTSQDPTLINIGTTYTASGSSGTTLKVADTTGIITGMIVIGQGFASGQAVVSVSNGTTVILNAAPDSTPTDGTALTFTGLNYVYWQLVVPGTAWLKFWQPTGNYTVGDLVVYKNVTYRCIQNNASGPNQHPDLDTNNLYWTVYTRHAAHNALTNQGDLLTYSSGNYTSLPIGLTDQTLSTTTANGEITPSWKQILTSPNVYYVAPTGLDSVEQNLDGTYKHGTTWDRPWKTIKYACNVLLSPYNPNSKSLIEKNKDWMLDEMYNWMLYQKVQSNSPYSPSSSFDETKTRRDAELLLDAIVYDFTRGGNSQTVAHALAYFKQDNTNSFITTGVAATKSYITTSLTFLKSLVLSNVLLNTPPTTSYQTLMGIPVGNRSSFVTGLSSEIGVITTTTALFDLVINSLTAQDTSLIPAPNTGITATICVKTGTYEEELPIVVPENVAIVGDELRGAVVIPATSTNTTIDATTAVNNAFVTTDTDGLVNGSPVQFSGSNIFGGIEAGKSYYVIDSQGVNQGTAEVNAIPYLNGGLLHADGHSKILGYALDGYPIYGPYGYDLPMDSNSTPRIMTSGYGLKDATWRTPTLASDLSAYPMGIFIEDYIYNGGSDLDAHNGRHCVTPDFPNGTYAYFTTINPATLVPVYPYVVGPTYFGSPNTNTNDYSDGRGYLPETYNLKYVSQTSNFDGVQSRWTFNETGTSVRVRANGVPYHSFHNSASAYIPKIQNYDLTFPHNGGVNVPASPSVAVSSGLIGFWLNGVAIYSPISASTPANKVAVTGFTFNSSFESGSELGYSFNEDLAGGATDSSGLYHYTEYAFDGSWITGSGSTIVGSALTLTTFSISAFPGGPVFPLQTATSFTILGTIPMYAFGGDAVKDMFRMRNGSGLRNMTLSGLLGSMTNQNTYGTRRPTGGSFVSLDPGSGPNDSAAWIIRRSPYAQNITNFGVGCTGMKVDGTLHNGGNKSMVANDFTQIISDGIGAWITGPDSKAELISVFTYYNYAGYFAENGGKIRAANGNSSYGNFGVIAEGYDITESPISGRIDNRETQASASVQQSFGTNQNILKLQYKNAGQNYNTPTVNMLSYSNLFTNGAWANDGNITLQQNLISPNGYADAWTISGLTGSTDSSYIYQNIAVTPTGAVYTNLSGSNISGSGSGATFDVTVNATSYTVTVNASSNGGTGYVFGNQITIYGSQVGGIDGTNDITLTVASLNGSKILTVTNTGTVPAGSALNYTLSIYAKRGSAPAFDLYAIYSGSSTRTSYVTFNFNTLSVTPGTGGDGGFTPSSYGVQSYTNGWYRVWFAVYDANALNNQLQFRVYPRTKSGAVGYTYFYGSQVEIGTSPNFYLSTTTGRYSSYADYIISGSGTGAIIQADEIRSTSIYQTRIVDSGDGVPGGAGYLTASNNAQGGDTQSITLAQSDTRTSANYNGMRVFVNSGTGAGQYGFISSFNASNKIAYVLKESITPLAVTNTTSGTNLLSLSNTADVNTLYVNQPVQFIPTYYSSTVSSTSLSSMTITSVTGGTGDFMTVASTAGLYYNMAVTFSGTNIYGGVIGNYTYYISNVIDSTTFQLSSTAFGNSINLNTTTTESGMVMNIPSNTSYMTGSTTNMVINMPIQFTGLGLGGVSTGTIYYINDVIDSNTFTISGSLTNVTVTAIDVSSRLSVTSTSTLVPMNPIMFSETTVGGIVANTKYYISTIENSTQFTVASSLIRVAVSSTAALTNLITVTSTAGFVVGHPIKFTGISFGGLTAEQTYYIQAINDSTTFTISTTNGGNAVSLSTAVGIMTARTCPTSSTLTSGSGSMPGTTTSAKVSLTTSIGTMNAIFSTPIFGGVSAGTTYYVKAINTGATNTFTISTSQGGSEVSLTTASGTMQAGEVGWDHVNPGTPILNSLDSTSVYYVEPRLTYSTPGFSQSSATGVTMATNYQAITYGLNTWMAIPQGNQTIATSTDGTTWTPITLPTSAPALGAIWSGIAYGNTAWVIISGGAGQSSNKVVYSMAKGQSWKTSTMPSSTSWSSVAYGGGSFVAIATGTASAAYSTTYGASWSAASLPSSGTWSSVAYGAGIFVAVKSGGGAAYSTNGGATWTAASMPSASAWTKVRYGNGRFVAVPSTSANPAYSLDGITWYSSNYALSADALSYGNGIFVALTNSSTTAWVSEDGLLWKQKTVSSSSYSAIAFGFTASSNDGKFVTVGGTSTVTNISAGAQAKGRPVVTSGNINSVTEFETGANYAGTASVTVFDPNVTTVAQFSTRIASGTLSAPTFINRGSGYNTSSTVISVNGNGFADAFQTGLSINVNNLTQLPRPGDDLTITGNDIVYKVTNASILNGTTAPNLTASIQISPSMTVALSPAHGTRMIVREKYSQVRLTNHDFLNVGYGDQLESNYPGVPVLTELQPQNQTIENNYGRVFYTSTDQDGNFKVGGLFGVEQATGIVTLSASQFGLSGLSQLTLGGIAVGGSSTVITQFSTDQTFVANSDKIIPTQRAIRAYLTSRLSQGGSNTFTGQTTAGTVVIGGPNVINNTIPQGTAGSSVKMLNKVNITGIAGGGVDGGLMAYDFFINNGAKRST